jgi:SAM-dependent methyltransferase
MAKQGDWQSFIDITRGREPREWLVRALESAAPPRGVAYDLGCGAGNDTLFLLGKGFDVIAVDITPTAIQMTRDRAREAGLDGRLRTVVGSFGSVDFGVGAADLIHAGFSLPFSTPGGFDELWAAIGTALVPGGLFVGQLFGDRDEWAATPGDVANVFHTRGDVDGLTAEFERVAFEEVERDGQVADGTPKHWHVYHMILRRESA